MISRTLNRSGMLLILSGILLAGGMIFHPGMDSPDYAAAPAWAVVHVLLGLSTLFGLAGLDGLFNIMAVNLRPLGRIAFGLALFANVLLTGFLLFVQAAILPVLARSPEFQPLTGLSGPLMAGVPGTAAGVTMLIAAIGYLLLAWYLVDTRTISIANGALFIGAPLLLFSPPLSFGIGIIGGLLLGAGIAWLGFSIRMGIAHRSLESSLRLHDECLAHMGHA